jgi:hypothetical protein
MKMAIKVFGIIGILIGVLGFIGLLEEPSTAGFIGCGLFLYWGILSLVFLDSISKKRVEFVGQMKVFGYIGVFLGGITLLASMIDSDFFSLLGGSIFFSWGLVTLNFIQTLKKIKTKK